MGSEQVRMITWSLILLNWNLINKQANKQTNKNQKQKTHKQKILFEQSLHLFVTKCTIKYCFHCNSSLSKHKQHKNKLNFWRQSSSVFYKIHNWMLMFLFYISVWDVVPPWEVMPIQWIAYRSYHIPIHY